MITKLQRIGWPMIKKIYMLLMITFLFPMMAFALPQHWIVPADPKTLYSDEKFCPEKCYPIVKDGMFVEDYEISVPQVGKDGGVTWMVDADKKRQKDADSKAKIEEKAAEEKAKDSRTKRVGELLDKMRKGEGSQSDLVDALILILEKEK